MSHGPFVCRGRFSFIPSARRGLCLLRPPLTSSVFRIVTVASCGGSSRFSFCNDFVFFSPWTSAHTLDVLPPSGGGLGPGAGVQRANPGCWTRRAPQPSSSTSHVPPRLGDGDAGKSRRGERGRLTGAASPLGRDRRAAGSSPGPLLRAVSVAGSRGEGGPASPGTEARRLRCLL